MAEIRVVAPDGVPEVREGDDLVGLLLPLVVLTDGDIVVVTSKIVSKAEGRTRPGTREDALSGETVRVLARRGPTSIVRTRHGLTMAAAGIDASNVEAGRVVLLPEDPDASARALRRTILHRTGLNVGVVVTDTAGRAWREGQTDIAVGAAGLTPLETYAGRVDAHGNELAVTAPAVADEIAGVAELAQGKLGRRPFAVLSGRADLVLPPDDDGPGARALIRPDGADMFGLGAREAVVAALAGRAADRPPFGSAASPDELADAVRTVLPHTSCTVEHTGQDTGEDRPQILVRGARAGDSATLAALGFAHGWGIATAPDAALVRFLPHLP